MTVRGVPAAKRSKRGSNNMSGFPSWSRRQHPDNLLVCLPTGHVEPSHAEPPPTVYGIFRDVRSIQSTACIHRDIPGRETQAGPRSTMPLVRCAIYTRKSTEEGLEQEFN